MTYDFLELLKKRRHKYDKSDDLGQNIACSDIKTYASPGNFTPLLEVTFKRSC